ncbi:MAG: hypothetical protein OEZ06_24405 [Myxococcales bacterium]|nr:hypothetical protein [Myxococcales bacterium]
MIKYNKRLQMLWHEYQVMLGEPGTPKGMVEWAVAEGKLDLPDLDPHSALVRDVRHALRTETRTDENGREYRANAAVTFTNDGGVQESLWGDVDSPGTPHEFMVEHFGQRRKQIVDDCAKLKADVDHYNAVHRDRDPVQLILDFTDDVAEREAMREIDSAAE